MSDKKLIDWETFKPIALGLSDECKFCEHGEEGYCRAQSHEDCSIWEMLNGGADTDIKDGVE